MLPPNSLRSDILIWIQYITCDYHTHAWYFPISNTSHCLFTHLILLHKNCFVRSLFRKYEIYFSKGFLTFKYYITAFAFCFDNFFPFVNNWSVSALSVGFSYTCPDPMERSGYPEVANLYIYLVVPTLLHLQFKECKEIPHKSFRALLLLVLQHNFQIP